jgi:hypothetical protein
MTLSLPQQRALATLPKITGFASVIFSSLIAYTVVRDKSKKSKVYHRLLLGMSIADISSSFWLALSTWPIPEETGILWASGNTMTCTFQGFFTQFGISSPIYNASLSIYYLLVIRYGWKEEQLKRIEPFLHGVPLLWGLGTAIAGLFLTIFNSANLWCWVAPYEDRGENADIYRWAFFYGPLWLMVVLVTVNLIFVWVFVRNITKRSENHIYGDRVRANMNPETGMSSRIEVSSALDMPNNSSNAGDTPSDESVNSVSRNSFVSRLQHSMSSLRPIDSASQSRFAKRRGQVANQCFRYGGAFYFTWIPITVRNSQDFASSHPQCSMSKGDHSYFIFLSLLQLVRIFQTVDVEVMYGFLLLAAINTPLQGLPNFLVYLYPKFAKLRRTKPALGFWGRVRKSMATGEPKNGVDDLIEQRLESHKEGEAPAAGDTGQNAAICTASIPINSEDSEDDIKSVGDGATTRIDSPWEAEYQSRCNVAKNSTDLPCRTKRMEYS